MLRNLNLNNGSDNYYNVETRHALFSQYEIQYKYHTVKLHKYIYSTGKCYINIWRYLVEYSNFWL